MTDHEGVLTARALAGQRDVPLLGLPLRAIPNVTELWQTFKRPDGKTITVPWRATLTAPLAAYAANNKQTPGQAGHDIHGAYVVARHAGDLGISVLFPEFAALYLLTARSTHLAQGATTEPAAPAVPDIPRGISGSEISIYLLEPLENGKLMEVRIEGRPASSGFYSLFASGVRDVEKDQNERAVRAGWTGSPLYEKEDCYVASIVAMPGVTDMGNAPLALTSAIARHMPWAESVGFKGLWTGNSR